MTDMLAACGYSAGCAGCRHKRSGFTGARHHTDACRRRIAEAIRADNSERGSRFKVCVSRAQVRLGHSKESQDAVMLADEPERVEEGGRSTLVVAERDPEEEEAFLDALEDNPEAGSVVDVVEMYSPPRRTPVGWDFRLPPRKVRPKLVAGSPGCTVSSQLQNLCGSHWDRHRRDRLEEAQNHVRFIVEVYWEQVNHGRWFLHEHPVGSDLLAHGRGQKVAECGRVCTTVADQCQYGLKTRGAGGAGSMPARKRTKFMTNSSEIANELSWKCPKDHLHQALVGGRAHKAAIYPEGLCEAICRGLKREIRRSKMNVRVLTTVISTDKIGTDTSKNRGIAHEEDGGSVGIAYGMAWDDLTGATLDPREVSKARF